MEDLVHHQETERRKALAINQNHLTHHQEMERKKVLVTRENLVLEISQNPSSYGRSSSSSRDGEKKSFGYKGKSSFGDKSKSI